MEASEEKRKQYRETIKDIPAESLVYIDESGINMSICKDRRRGKKKVRTTWQKERLIL